MVRQCRRPPPQSAEICRAPAACCRVLPCGALQARTCCCSNPRTHAARAVNEPLGLHARLAKCLNRFLNVKAVVAAFNQEKALVVSMGFLCAYIISNSAKLKALNLTHLPPPPPLLCVLENSPTVNINLCRFHSKSGSPQLTPG